MGSAAAAVMALAGARTVMMTSAGACRGWRAAEALASAATSSGRAFVSAGAGAGAAAAAAPKGRRERPPLMQIGDAIDKVKRDARARFDESVDLALRLGVDPKRSDMLVRGALQLPHGTGKSPGVAVFLSADESAGSVSAAALEGAGAAVVGSEELVKQLAASGNVAEVLRRAEICLATPAAVPLLAPVARMLGPKGLMPNRKLGTVVAGGEAALVAAVRAARAGRVQYRMDKGANLHVPIGRVSFGREALLDNAAVLIRSLLNVRPKGLKGSGSKGYFDELFVSSTMGRSVQVDLPHMVAFAMQHRVDAAEGA